MRVLEAELRQANGRLEEMKKTAHGVANELEFASTRILCTVAATLVESWSKQGTADDDVPAIVDKAVIGAVQEQTESLRRRMDALTHRLCETLRATAKVLEVEDMPAEHEFSGVVREMPAFDLGHLNVRMRRPVFLTLLGGELSRSLIRKRLSSTIGEQLAKSLSAYHALLYDWSQRTLGQIQRRFDAYANSYRAQVERLVGSHASPAGEKAAIVRDLEGLESARRQPTAAS